MHPAILRYDEEVRLVPGMSAKNDGGKVAGVAVVACAAYCAGPIIAFLGAIGLGTVLGVFLFGGVGLGVAGLAVLWWFRRRKRQQTCAPSPVPSMPVTIAATRTRSDA